MAIERHRTEDPASSSQRSDVSVGVAGSRDHADACGQGAQVRAARPVELWQEVALA